MKKVNLNAGHRIRMREKFVETPNSLYDYELLEMFLYSRNAVKDTRLVAKQLLYDYGNLHNIINADLEELTKVDGIGYATAVQIKLFKELLNRVLQIELKEKPIELNNLVKVQKYCQTRIGDLKQEVIQVLYVNNQLNLLTDEILNNGTNKQVVVNKLKLLTKADIYGASKIILAHNHPSGDPTPSIQDIELTKSLNKLLKQFDIDLIEHVVVSKSKTFSMHKNNLLG